jgi:hypothetical protein
MATAAQPTVAAAGTAKASPTVFISWDPCTDRNLKTLSME